MLIRVIRGLAFFAIIVLLTSRCANVQQGPGGGPRDTLSPLLVGTIPEFYTINQRPKKVVLQFNEYVQVKDASKNVTVSPPSILRPEIRTRGKGVEVIFNDTLKQETTYTIDFGTSISDLNESNPFLPFRFVFTTGAAVDSMMLTGKVLDAYTRDPLPAMTVALYTDRSDTAIYKTMPVAVARTDDWGYFTVQNIKPAEYAMVAFLDKNNNYRYDAGSEMLAFVDSTLRPEQVVTAKMLATTIDPKDTAVLLARPYEWEMYAFTENTGKQFLKEQTMPGKRQINLLFNRPHAVVDTFQIKGVDSSYLVKEHSRFRDTLIYWITAPELPDTTNVNISYLKTDSLDQLVPFSAKLRLQLAKEKEEEPKNKKDEEKKKQGLKPVIKYDIASIMKSGVNISFPTLLAYADSSKVQLTRKDAKDKTAKINEPFTLTRDTLRIRQYHLQAKWQTGTDYELLILPGAFGDIYGLPTDSVKQAITTGDPDKFSSMKLAVSGIVNGEQVILQLLDEKKKSVLREKILVADSEVQLDYLKPGKYTIRLIRDNNKNGIWDSGIYLERRQSELAEFYTLPDGKEVIELLDNADLTQQINAETVFARSRKDELPQIIHTHDEEEEEHDHED